MGWKPAQEISGRDWLYPYLIYSLTDRYAAVRFDAWKSLQTLPGFGNFTFNYTDDGDALSAAAARALDQWSTKVRSHSAVYPAETGLDPQGHPVVTGYTKGDLDGKHAGNTSDDVFVANLGCLLLAHGFSNGRPASRQALVPPLKLTTS